MLSASFFSISGKVRCGSSDAGTVAVKFIAPSDESSSGSFWHDSSVFGESRDMMTMRMPSNFALVLRPSGQYWANCVELVTIRLTTWEIRL